MSSSSLDKTETEPPPFVAALLLATVFSLGFMKPSVAFGGIRLTPTDFLFPFLLIAFLTALLLGRIRLKSSPAYPVFGFYALAMAISAAYSENPTVSFTRLIGELYLICLAIVTLNVVRSEKILRRVVFAWIAGASFPIIIGLATLIAFYIDPQNRLFELFTYQYGAVPVGSYPRLSATFVSASMFCNYLNVTFFVLILARSKNWIGMRYFSAAVAAVVVCAIFTISAGLGAFIFSAGYYVSKLLKTRGLFFSRAILAFSGLAGIAVTALSFFELLPRAGTGSLPDGEFAPSPRVRIWQQALNTIAENPLTGRGVGLPVVNVVYRNAEGTTSVLTDAHNVFLNIGAEAGFLGIAAAVWICILMIAMMLGRKTAFELRSVRVWLILAFIASFIGQGLTGSFEDARHIWVLFGLITAVGSFADAA